MSAFLARMKRGFARMWAKHVMNRPNATPGQIEQARETAVSLGLMAEAADAGAAMTPEQQIFLSQSEHGMRERLSVLLSIPHRSLAQEREKLAIETWLRRGLEPAPAPAPIRGFMGRAAAGVAAGWQVWAIGAAIAVSGWGVAAVQAALKERVEDQRDQARAERNAMEASRNAYARQLGEERAAHARDVAAVLEDTARTVEQLERQAARARARVARERSRHEDLANGSINFGERLRELAEPDPGLSAPAAPAAGGGPAGGVSAAPGRDTDPDAAP